MSQEIPARWREQVRQHIHQTGNDAYENLRAENFRSDRSVSIHFPDGSYALFRYAFFLKDKDLNEVAVFTEHCGYHYFPLYGLRLEVLQSVGGSETEERDIQTNE